MRAASRPRVPCRLLLCRRTPARPMAHVSPPSASPSVAPPPPDPAFQRMREHQATAAKPSFAAECRTLLALSRYAVLSTISSATDTPGFPSGSVVGYADDGTGRPVFSLSTMSGHTRDVAKDGRGSLTVTHPGFEGAADARVSFTGTMAKVPASEAEAARLAYQRTHPDAFWADFGDFSLWRLEPLAIRLVGGFARAGSVPPAVYFAARPDPVAALAPPLLAAANAAGHEMLAAMVCKSIGTPLAVSRVALVSADALGVDAAVSIEEGDYKLRLPWPGGAVDSQEGMERALRAMM